MNKLKGWKDLLNKENDGFKYLIPDNLWIMKHEGKLSKMAYPLSNNKVERIALGKHDEECLSSNKNLDEDFKDELKHDETWRTPVMKAWEVEDEKNKIQGMRWIRWSFEMI